MKKLTVLILALVMAFSFCSCGEKSPEQQLAEARKQTEQAKKNADSAQKQLDDLRDAIDRYESAKEQIDNWG